MNFYGTITAPTSIGGDGDAKNILAASTKWEIGSLFKGRTIPVTTIPFYIRSTSEGIGRTSASFLAENKRELYRYSFVRRKDASRIINDLSEWICFSDVPWVLTNESDIAIHVESKLKFILCLIYSRPIDDSRKENHYLIRCGINSIDNAYCTLKIHSLANMQKRWLRTELVYYQSIIGRQSVRRTCGSSKAKSPNRSMETDTSQASMALPD